MANEFVAKNGLISQNNTTVSGSLTVTQNVSASSFTGSLLGTAATASFLPIATYQITSSWAVSASQAITASYALNGGGGSTFPYNGSAIITGSLLVSGSGLTISGSLTVSGSLTTLRNGLTVTGSTALTGSLTASGFTQLLGTGTSTLGSNLVTSAGLIVGTVGQSGVLGFGAYANNGGEIQSAQNNGVSIAGQLTLQRQGGVVTIGTGTDSGYRLELTGNGPSGSFRIAPAFTSTSITASSIILITGSIQQVQSASAQIYGVNISPTMIYTTGSQTTTTFRIAPTFTGSVAFSSSQQNIVADFGAVGAGTQFSINDITSGSIYMVNDISGLPIIEALSDWTVNMYNYPTKIFQKTGSAIITTGSMSITGSLTMSPTSSFILPLTASSSPAIGSAYWSGSLLFIYNGTRYMSASFV